MKPLLLATLLFVCGCAAGPGRLPTLPADTGGAYLLGAGDTLKINVFGEADLSGEYKVADTGGIIMPLIGTVAALGLTVPDFQKRLTQALNAKAVKSPDVTVQIGTYRPFFILGEVKNPGSYPYVPDMTVLTAVAIAGGFTFRAAEDEVSVTRKRDGAAREARAGRDARILPGDTVYVFERHF